MSHTAPNSLSMERNSVNNSAYGVQKLQGSRIILLVINEQRTISFVTVGGANLTFQRPVMPGRRDHKSMSWRGNAKDAWQDQNWERKRKFKPILPLVVLGSVRSLADEMEKLGELSMTQWECQQSKMIYFIKTWLQKRLQSLYRADNKVTVKEEWLQCFLTTDGVIMALLQKSVSATRMLKRLAECLSMFLTESCLCYLPSSVCSSAKLLTSYKTPQSIHADLWGFQTKCSITPQI